MLDTSGNLRNYKTITPRTSSQSFQVPLFLAPYSNGDVSLLIGVYGDVSFYLGDNTIPRPNTINDYYIAIRADASYTNFSYKVLNPEKTNFYDNNGPGLTMNLSKEDSLYLVLTAGNSSDINYDGLHVPAYQKNTLVVFDPFLIAKRVVSLGGPFFNNNDYKGRLLFRTVNTSGNDLLLTGTYYRCK
ncbi:MAG: hypothetical protein ABIU11_01895 [Chitinophagaceae bacterium]